MAEQQPFHVAIVGGGLGGISLGIALRRRNIPFTLHERGRSFTEIGAGINLGPSAVRTLRLIDPSLGEKVDKLATRNPVPNENVWMDLRYGAPWEGHEDGEVFHRIMAPPTGNMTFHRQEILALLAEEMGQEHAKFNKKLESYSQTHDRVTLKFSDGTEETASLLVGCDGIHSKVRTCMFGADNPLSKPTFSQSGCYRAVIPIETAIEAIGESARLSTVTITPNGYLISYPVSGGTKMNCGAWTTRPNQKDWTHPGWTLPNQREQFKEDFKTSGRRVQKILALFDQDPSFWATFQHANPQPSSFVDNLVILIGDAAHSMPPHQGAGASQAIEDAYILAEALASINQCNSSASGVKVVLRAVEAVRLPRFSTVQKFSKEGGERWFGLWEKKLEGEALQEWIGETERRLKWIWEGDLEGDAGRVTGLIEEWISGEKKMEEHGE